NLFFSLCLMMLLLGVSWTMTSLTDSPVLISLVQTMMSLPFLLFAIPAGVATDRFGHRVVLLASQFWLLAVLTVMGVIALTDGLRFTPTSLLAMTFLVGIGVVAQQTAWKPFIQGLVPQDFLVEVISFNGLSSDVGRGVGPVLAGYLMHAFGPAVVLFTSVVSQMGMIATLRNAPGRRDSGEAGPARRSLRQAWALIRGSPRLYGPMLRCALLVAPCGAVMGLLPLVAKEDIQTGPIGYGGLLAALSIGGAAGGALMPVLRRRVALSSLTTVALAAFALAVIGVSQWNSMTLDAGFLLLLGVTWSLLSIAHQFAIQFAAPEDMSGLTNSIYSLVNQGALAGGSLLFGVLAHYTGVSRSILIAGMVAMSGLLLVRRYPLTT
ncbi:MAG: MFS transporter, partial [Mycobacterium sp.]